VMRSVPLPPGRNRVLHFNVAYPMGEESESECDN